MRSQLLKGKDLECAVQPSTLNPEPSTLNPNHFQGLTFRTAAKSGSDLCAHSGLGAYVFCAVIVEMGLGFRVLDLRFRDRVTHRVAFLNY